MLIPRLAAHSLRISTLRWGVGCFCSIIGATMLVSPHQFRSPVYDALRPNLPVWGVTFLLIGIALVGLTVYRPRRLFATLIHVAAGAELLLLAYGLWLAGSWTGATNLACLGLGTLAAPVVGVAPICGKGERPPDLLFLAIGIGATLTGLPMLVLPDLYTTGIFDSIRPFLAWMGLAFFSSGIVLSYAHLSEDRPAGVRVVAHLFAGGTLLAFFLASALPLRAWIGIAYYGGFGLAGALDPVLGAFTHRIEIDSLRSRLAFSFAVIASLPLILAVALVEEMTIGYVSDQTSVQHARDAAFVVLLATSVTAAVIGTLIARRVTQPLRGLGFVADALARGDDAISPPETKIGEIANLARAFLEMRERLAARTAERQQLLDLVREQAARAEQRAAELDAVLDSMADGLAIYDRHGNLVRLNSAAVRIIGYSADELAGDLREPAAIIAPRREDGDPLAPEEHPAARALRGETTNGLTMLLDTRGGRAVWASVGAAPIRLPSGDLLGAVMTFSDVTAQQQLEQAREEFVSLVSHDLRNPLTVLRGQAQLLQRQLERLGQHSLAGQATTIVRYSDRMTAIIRDLVESSRLEAGRLQLRRVPTDVANLLRDVVEVATSPDERGRVRLEVPDRLPEVALDPEQVVRLVSNLLDNALKYSSATTGVVVRAAADADELCVSVIDEGVGIPAVDLPHVFDKYFRAQSGLQVEGIGLGLYICRLIVEAHGGRIWAQSEPGRGSTFAFALPLR